MKKGIILLTVFILTGCSLSQHAAEEMDRERVHARMLVQEAIQYAEQMRRYAEARLQQTVRVRGHSPGASAAHGTGMGVPMGDRAADRAGAEREYQPGTSA